MTTSPIKDPRANKSDLQVWLKTIAIGFGLASIGILIALLFKLLT